MIKRLAQCIGKYKKESILAPVTVAFEVILEVLIPLLMANLIDFGIDKGNMPYILKMGGLLLLSSFLSLAFGMLAGRYASFASAGFAKNLREKLFSHLQDFSFSNIDRFSSASLVTRMTTDVSNVQMAYQMIIRTAVRSPLMLLFSLIASIRIDAKLSMILVVFIPILGGTMYLITKSAHPTFVKVFKTYDKLNSTVQEDLRGIRVVKSYNRGEHEKEKFNSVSQTIYDYFSKAERTISFASPTMQLCMYATMLLIAWFGARAVVASGNDQLAGLSTGELMSLFTYSMQILSSLMMLSMMLVMTTMARTSAGRIVEVLDEKSSITSPENAETVVADGSIDFNGVYFSYSDKSDKPCLDNVTVSIASGETVGILGGTGSSKSTFVQMIPRLYDVTSGTVSVGGRDVRDYDLTALRDAVAMVLQKNLLFSGTIRDNMRWGNESATDEEIARACQIAQADGFIDEFPDGYDTHIEQGGSNVSGGQRQRLCIARAILKKPKILILDDSTSAVDTATDKKIRNAFREELQGVTKLIIAQRVASVMEADKIIIMDDGRIAAVGTHDELIKTCDIYREVYDSQMKGGDDNE